MVFSVGGLGGLSTFCGGIWGDVLGHTVQGFTSYKIILKEKYS
jgi:hypothetical protein